MSMKRFKLSDVTIKIRKRKVGGTRTSALSPVYKEILSLEIGECLAVDIPEGKTLEQGRSIWTQRLVTTVRPALMNREGVKHRYDLSKDFEAIIADVGDGEECVAIQCTENTCTEELYEKYKARSQKQQASKAAKKAANAEPKNETPQPKKAAAVDNVKPNKNKKAPKPAEEDDIDEITL